MKGYVLLSLLMLCNICMAQLPPDARSISPLLIGESIPDLSLLNTDNKSVKLMQLIQEKPTVLIFYRGGWCPYCTAQLGSIAAIENDIIKAGYQVIAISPDAPERLSNTIDKKELKYTLLSDGDGKLCTAMGIAYTAPDAQWKMNRLDKHSDGKNPGFLPVPSVFVVDKKGEILFEYINPNYKHRIEGKLLMAVLNALN